MNEYTKRDRAIDQVQANPENNFQRLLEVSVSVLRGYRPGKILISDDLFHAAINRYPFLKPNERRVMGAVMRDLKKQGLIQKTRIISSPKRTHGGNTTEWVRV